MKKLTQPIILPVSAYLFLSSSVQVRPSDSVYGVYCVNKSTTWCPGGAKVGSRLDGMVISIIGLKNEYIRVKLTLPKVPVTMAYINMGSQIFSSTALGPVFTIALSLDLRLRRSKNLF